MSSLVLIYFTNSYLGPQCLYFLNLLQGSGVVPGVQNTHGGRLPTEVGSHLKGFKETVDHRPSETLIIIYGWDADVSEKQQGCCCQTKPNL